MSCIHSRGDIFWVVPGYEIGCEQIGEDAMRARMEAAAAREAILQKRSIEEFSLAEAMLVRATNRLRVRRRNS